MTTIQERNPQVDETIRSHPEVERAMKLHLQMHPSCARCGGTKDCQVHHKKSLWMFVDEQMDVQIQHASDPNNFITLCECPESHDCHLIWGHDGCFAEKCVPNIDDVLALRQVAHRQQQEGAQNGSQDSGTA